MKPLLRALSFTLGFLFLAACQLMSDLNLFFNPAATEINPASSALPNHTPLRTFTPEPTSVFIPIYIPTPTTQNGFTTFVDIAGGYAIDYPSDWYIYYFDSGTELHISNYKDPFSDGEISRDEYVCMISTGPDDSDFEEAVQEITNPDPDRLADIYDYYHEDWILYGDIPAIHYYERSKSMGELNEIITLFNQRGIGIGCFNTPLYIFSDIAYSLRPIEIQLNDP